jgi:hypothetical protein
MILDLGIEHDVHPLEVSSSINEFLEVINVFVNSPPVLEEP